MEESYKGQRPTVSAWHISDTKQWQPKLQIIWREGTDDAIKYPVISRYFATQSETETAA